jgi:hypothetical protein
MKQPLKRREFLIKGSQAGIACCAMLIGAQRLAYGGSMGLKADKSIDPKSLTYCGYICPADCKFLQASVKNDAELKKQVYQDWKIKEKYNIDFDAEKIFCFGCKNKEKPEGVLLTNCTVRQCAMAKGFECCLECKELTECDKALWSHYPDFKKQVIEMQKKYFAEQAG